jgi:transcriptional antiterminator RfaH
MKNWHVVHSKPQKEILLWEQLCLRDIETYYPRIRVQTVNPRARGIKPYFPGYLFIRVDWEHDDISSLRWMPGSSGLVSFGDAPAILPDEILQKIKLRVYEINNVGGVVFDGLKPGDTIIIRDGPFKGYEAIFDSRLPGDMRVRVLLELLQGRQLRVELPAGQIEQIKQF